MLCPELTGTPLAVTHLGSNPFLALAKHTSQDFTTESVRYESLIEPKLGMFTRRRLRCARPLDLPQFDGMPG